MGGESLTRPIDGCAGAQRSVGALIESPANPTGTGGRENRFTDAWSVSQTPDGA